MAVTVFQEPPNSIRSAAITRRARVQAHSDSESELAQNQQHRSEKLSDLVLTNRTFSKLMLSIELEQLD